MRPTRGADLRQLFFILAVAAVHGWIYLFLVPPWQHYDEPNHFEFAWMIADRGALPGPDDHDQALNYTLFASLLEHNFFDWMDEPPALGAPDDRVQIPGYSQRSEPPLYYLLVSLPLRLLSETPIEIQLYAARLVSFVLYLLTVFAAWGLTRELAGPGHALRWMAPLTLAALPAFTDIMTAVNSDAGAIAAASFFLWGSVRLVRRGFSLVDFAWVIIAALISSFTKNIAVFTLFILPFVLLFSLFRGKLRPVAWGLAAAGAVFLVVYALAWGDAAYWHRASSQRNPTRQASGEAVVGDYVLVLDTHAPVIPIWFPPVFQSLPVELAADLQGKVLTFGFWMWADQPMEAQSPVLIAQSQETSQRLELGSAPQFYAFRVQAPEDTQRIWVYLDPRLEATPAGRVFYDGFVLAEGAYLLEEPPVFEAASAAGGDWGGQRFTNLLRNPSVEAGAPRVRAWIDDLGAQLLPNQARPSLLLMYFGDWTAMKYFHLLSVDRCFRSFWAQFGWGNVSLQMGWIYGLLAVAVLAALASAIIGMIRQRRQIPWDVAFIFALALALTWGMTLSRSFGFAVQYKFYVPVARHAFPAIIPAVILLTFGWLEIIHWLARGWRWVFGNRKMFLAPCRMLSSSQGLQMALYSIPWLLLDVISLVSIMRFYGG